MDEDVGLNLAADLCLLQLELDSHLLHFVEVVFLEIALHVLELVIPFYLEVVLELFGGLLLLYEVCL